MGPIQVSQAHRKLYEAGSRLQKRYTWYCRAMVMVMMMVETATLDGDYKTLYEKDSTPLTTNDSYCSSFWCSRLFSRGTVGGNIGLGTAGRLITYTELSEERLQQKSGRLLFEMKVETAHPSKANAMTRQYTDDSFKPELRDNWKESWDLNVIDPQHNRQRDAYNDREEEYRRDLRS